MSVPDNLDTLTDQQLNDVLAALLPPPEHLLHETVGGSDYCDHCGWEPWQQEKECRIWWCGATHEVVKLLDQQGEWFCTHVGELPECNSHIIAIGTSEATGAAKTFTRAGVIALIRHLRR